MTKDELKDLRDIVLSYLTDKNVGFVGTETDEEQFGALMAFGYAFRNIDQVFQAKIVKA